MADLIRIKIITPEEIAYDGTALAVTIPAEMGEMQVYPGHIPVLARITAGEVRIEKPGSDTTSFMVDEGFLRVTPDEINLLVNTAQAVSSSAA